MSQELKEQIEKSWDEELGGKVKVEADLKEKVVNAFSDEALLETVLKSEDMAEIQGALKAKGIDMSLDEVKKMTEQIDAQMENDGELTDDQMEQVAGGIVTAFSACTLGVLLAYKAATVGASVAGSVIGGYVAKKVWHKIRGKK